MMRPAAGSEQSNRPLWVMIIVSALVVISAGVLWSGWATLDQVSQVQGQVVASARMQMIESASGGVIAAVLVQEGDSVKQGQLLARLEREQSDAARTDSLGKVAAIQANLSRLRAALSGQALTFPTDVLLYPALVASQTELFLSQRQALARELGALTERLHTVQEELALSEPLLRAGTAGKSYSAHLQSQAAELKEALVQRGNQYFQQARSEMARAKQELGTQEQILAERTATLEHADLLAPVDGRVRRIYLMAPGAKVNPGAVVMELLPTHSTLLIEVKLHPADVALMWLGMPVSIRFEAGDAGMDGALRGKVSYISPAAFSEETGNGEHIDCQVHISLDDNARSSDGRGAVTRKIDLRPGMRASVEIPTGARTILQYLSKPS